MYSVCRFLWLQELEKKSAKGRNVSVVDETVSPIRDNQGEIAGKVVVFRDVTERKKS